jgi:Ca2+-binding RTX toxin-like protein
VRDGYATYSDGKYANGGAIFAKCNSLSLDHATFSGNSTYNNADPGYGGAIFCTSTFLSIKNCTFDNNSSLAYNENGCGGAIFIENNRIIIEDSYFTDNMANRGGAVCAGNLHSSADLEILSSQLSGNVAFFGGGAVSVVGNLVLEDSIVSQNGAYISGVLQLYGSGNIARSLISNNFASGEYGYGGGIGFGGKTLSITDTTICNNATEEREGGGIRISSGSVHLVNSTITGNEAGSVEAASGGGIFLDDSAEVSILNCIITGNAGNDSRDIAGTIILSNGHNIFGSDVVGNVAADRENVAASAVFAAIDLATGGGLVNADGIVPLKASVTNPALGGADRFAIGSIDQIGTPRPSPTGTNPDAGAAESGFAHSTVSSANNDTLTGTATANTLNGLAGHDFLKGLGGNDTLNGGDGGDFLEGGTGNDKLNGGSGIDIANYGDSAIKVTVDLRGTADTDTAKRGSETDTLTGIEGAIAGGGADRFWGDGGANWFQGGGGKDTFTGGAGRELYDYNLTSASPTGSGRDVITDFAHLTDKIDLMGIDADSTVAGNQAFRWVGSAALTGPGEVGFFTSGGNTIVRMSTDADAASEGEIQLTGIKTLTALDFYF